MLAVVGSSARVLSGPDGASRSSTAPARESRSPPSSCPMRRRHWRRSAARACRTSARPRPAPTRSPRRWRGARRSRSPPASAPKRQAAAACSTNSKPTRCSSASASRARPRSRSMPASTQAPALPFPYPVAVKVLSAEIAHKTDVGGVVLGVADGAALLAAIADNPRQRGRTNARRPRRTRAGAADGLRPRRGAARLSGRPRRRARWSWWRRAACSPRSSATAACGWRRSMLAAAHEMIAEVRGLIALTGYRGKSAGDLDGPRRRHRRAVAAGG